MKPSGKISIAVATFVTLLESAAKSASAQAPVFPITPEKEFRYVLRKGFGGFRGRFRQVRRRSNIRVS
jgi:hypothetical protein